MEQAVTREEVVHTSRIPGLCRCPGDEQQEDQEEERCFVAHGEGFLFLVKLPASALHGKEDYTRL